MIRGSHADRPSDAVRRQTFGWAAAAVLAYVVCTALVATDALDGFDRTVASAMQRRTWHLLDVVASALAWPAGPLGTGLWIAVLGAVLLRRRHAHGPASGRWPRGRLPSFAPAGAGRHGAPRPTPQGTGGPLLILLVTVLAVGELVEVACKLALHHPQPPRSRSLGNVVGVAALVNSYPSGHMFRAIVLAGGTAALAGGRRRRRFVVVAMVWWLVLAATRVYIGDHWPTDVVGGVLLGVVSLSVFSTLATNRKIASLLTVL